MGGHGIDPLKVVQGHQEGTRPGLGGQQAPHGHKNLLPQGLWLQVPHPFLFLRGQGRAAQECEIGAQLLLIRQPCADQLLKGSGSALWAVAHLNAQQVHEQGTDHGEGLLAAVGGATPPGHDELLLGELPGEFLHEAALANSTFAFQPHEDAFFFLSHGLSLTAKQGECVLAADQVSVHPRQTPQRSLSTGDIHQLEEPLGCVLWPRGSAVLPILWRPPEDAGPVRQRCHLRRNPHFSGRRLLGDGLGFQDRRAGHYKLGCFSALHEAGDGLACAHAHSKADKASARGKGLHESLGAGDSPQSVIFKGQGRAENDGQVLLTT